MTPDTGATLSRELDWLETRVAHSVTAYVDGPKDGGPMRDAPPDLGTDTSDYAQFIKDKGLNADGRAIAILALAPVLRPRALDALLTRDPKIDRPFTEFGGAPNAGFGFAPTQQTALFLLAERDVVARVRIAGWINETGAMARGGLIAFGRADGVQAFARPLIPGLALRKIIDKGDVLTAGRVPNFLAQKLQTPLDWSDLLVPASTAAALEEIILWSRHRSELDRMTGVGRLLSPGYRALFSGPPGTGKTLAATLLGKRTGCDVYRIDLSMVVSRWIGETEANLDIVFATAEGMEQILFFDEADAIFGVRTEAMTANDRHANQEVSYLLRRIETFDGLIVMAANKLANLDPAFRRRFQTIVPFAPPDRAARLALWTRAFDGTDWQGADVDLPQLAEAHDLSGAMIGSVVQRATLRALEDGRRTVSHADLVAAIASVSRNGPEAVDAPS